MCLCCCVCAGVGVALLCVQVTHEGNPSCSPVWVGFCPTQTEFGLRLAPTLGVGQGEQWG